MNISLGNKYSDKNKDSSNVNENNLINKRKSNLKNYTEEGNEEDIIQPQKEEEIIDNNVNNLDQLITPEDINKYKSDNIDIEKETPNNPNTENENKENEDKEKEDKENEDKEKEEKENEEKEKENEEKEKENEEK